MLESSNGCTTVGKLPMIHDRWDLKLLFRLSLGWKFVYFDFVHNYFTILPTKFRSAWRIGVKELKPFLNYFFVTVYQKLSLFHSY